MKKVLKTPCKTFKHPKIERILIILIKLIAENMQILILSCCKFYEYENSIRKALRKSSYSTVNYDSVPNIKEQHKNKFKSRNLNKL